MSRTNAPPARDIDSTAGVTDTQKPRPSAPVNAVAGAGGATRRPWLKVPAADCTASAPGSCDSRVA